MSSSRTILITGVSTGIGYEAAKAFARKGYRIFGSVRNEEDGERLQSELGELFIPLVFDITDQAGIRQAVEQVNELLDGESLGGLINNAGIVIGGPLQHIPVEEIRHQFEVNVFGLLSLTQSCLPLLFPDRWLDRMLGKRLGMIK